MKVHIISIFPEAFESYFNCSIIGKAIKNGFFEPIFYKLNNFSIKKFKQVDSKAYGMHGQVISPEPLSKGIEFIFEKLGKKIPIIFLSPAGELLNQEKIENYFKNLKDEFIIICGHYEGIDERIIDIYNIEKVSCGEYVLSSGELGAMVFLDSLIRNIKGVLGNEKSLLEESFSEKLERKKEYPVYTSPKEFLGYKVPEVLVSGNHKEIEKWKKENLGKIRKKD